MDCVTAARSGCGDYAVSLALEASRHDRLVKRHRHEHSAAAAHEPYEWCGLRGPGPSDEQHRHAGHVVAEFIGYACGGSARSASARVVINTTTGIQISWGEPEDNGAAITGYRVELAIVNTFPGPRAFTPGSTARDQIVNTGLVEGTVYYVRARAMNSRGNAPWSEIVQITHDLVILADPPDAPNAPDGDS